MPAHRYYISAELTEGANTTLTGQEQHHLIHVMRGQVGDRIELVNGNGALAHASIQTLTRRDAVLSITEVHRELPSKLSVILAQAAPRANRLDCIIEKGTELGMAELWLFPGERSERVKYTESQLDRMNNVAISAMKQCGRLYLPKIVICDHFFKWKPFDGLALFGDVEAQKYPSASASWSEHSKIQLFIGPESGFSDKEIEHFRNSGVQGMKLHENILRKIQQQFPD